jgi:hypothetical protein
VPLVFPLVFSLDLGGVLFPLVFSLDLGGVLCVLH